MRHLAVLLLLLFSSACRDQESTDTATSHPSESTTLVSNDSATTQTSPMNPTLPPESDEPGSRPSAAAHAHEVHLIEYAIHMPQSVPAGRVAFNVENGGKENHAFEIEGNGVHQKSQELTRGNSTSVEVDLKPGTYTVYCPVDGHKDKGMRTTLVVK
jgi:plastocyanin